MPLSAKKENMNQKPSRVNRPFYWFKQGNSTTPLVMLHGHGGDHRGLIKLAEVLKCPVFIVDLPGFGNSKELEHHSMRAYVSALMEFANSQKMNEYHLLGHSLGSAVALALAAEDKRVKKLVLVNAVPEFTKMIRKLVRFMGDTAARLPEKVSETLIHAGLYNIATFLLHSTKRRDMSYARSYLVTQKTAQYSLRSWREAGEAIYGMQQIEVAKKVQVPTLLLHGDKDKMTTLKAVQEFSDIFKNARLERIPAAGHFIPLENISEAASIINHFLNETT